MDGLAEGGISGGCVLALCFHNECFAVYGLHLDCFILLPEVHDFGPFLLVVELDVNQVLGVYHDLCQVGICC